MSQSAKFPPPQEGARRGRTAPISRDALALTEAALKRAGFPDPTLVFRWPEIAGVDVAAVAKPIRCRQGPDGMVLTLKCESGAAVFLQHETRSLMDRLNAFLGAGTVVRVRILPGSLAPSDEIPPHPGRNLPIKPRDEEKTLAASLDRLAQLRQALPRRPGR
jgi:hypothetical protein